MEYRPESPHENNSEVLPVKKSSRSGRDAATQTPQIIRHATPTRITPVRTPSPGSSSSDGSLVFEDTNSHLPSMESVVETLVIPDVIVDHNKDTCSLTQDADLRSPQDLPSGITNLAFQGSDEITQPSSTDSFKETKTAHHTRKQIFLQPNHHENIPCNHVDSRKLPIGIVNRRLYHSLPKVPGRNHLSEEQQKIHSQPQTPQINRTKEASFSNGDSNFWSIPLEHSSNSINTMSAEPSKYATADSVASLYTVSGRSTSVSNGFSEPVINGFEMHLMSPTQTVTPSTPKSVKKFEFTKMPDYVDRKRRRLQWCTDFFSLLLLCLGFLIVLLTPFTTVPLFYVSEKHYMPYLLYFFASGILAVIIIFCSGVVGNIVWFYEEDKKRLRPRFHCGRGPTFHFWGNAFYKDYKDVVEL